MLYNVGGNYLGQGSDLGEVQAALEKVEFVVTHDYFMTPTASFSDVVLPVTTFLERDDIVFSNSKYLFYSAKAAEPVGESRSDYWIFSELSHRLGFYESFTESRTEKQWLDHFLENSEVEDRAAFKKTGIYAVEDQSYIGLSGFFKDPSSNPLNTPSGKIEIPIASLKGSIFETFVVTEVLKAGYNTGENFEIYFWRDNHKKEIDLIIDFGIKKYGIEIKSSETISEKYFDGLKYWRELTGMKKENLYLVYGGRDNLIRNGMNVVSWDNIYDGLIAGR